MNKTRRIITHEREGVRIGRVLADKAIKGFVLNESKVTDLLDKNPILVTALNPIIGYDKGARIAKTAYAEGKSLKEIALKESDETDQLRSGFDKDYNQPFRSMGTEYKFLLNVGCPRRACDDRDITAVTQLFQSDVK